MVRSAVCVCLAVALALAASACSERIRAVPATPQVVKQLGLPLYPHATLSPQGAQEMTMSSPVGRTISVIASYQTMDDFAKVRRFYDERLPSTKRVVSIPLGEVNTVTMQFSDKTARKQVTLVGVRGVTMIQLQSTTLSFARPTAEPSGPAPAAHTSPSPVPGGAR